MNKIHIKSQDEIVLMRNAGRLLAKVFAALDDFIKIGISTLEINDFVEDYIVHTLRARPASKGQYGYQYVLNSSINEVVCHGVPSKGKKLREGDIVNMDITLEKDGFIADSSKMYSIGKILPIAKKIMAVSYEAMWEGICHVKAGSTTGDIGYAIQHYAEKNGFSVVRDYCGHGIGRAMHEEPPIPHFGKPATGITLKEGMVFTVEPMINQGTYKVKQKKDGWTVITKDRKLSAQWEHTVLVTASGFEVLTLRNEEILPVV
ncbi:type I methionyl aminopeptidase [Legionella septentrionalis]|uniref:Methionine aminopeptidase n=1 Tax=Legionella septentrionalis TaxID=2498109 RepID=A0A3S1CK83_9GAMM|nr:type I methionyl aminopeptidase [Legionella septentrionalis]RUQ79188.1 type I methionyl aminopeptidase [Legionella septentrionalis]